MTAELEPVISATYQVDQYPALRAQSARWSASRPLSGLRVLDCTPLFRNTFTKYLPLLAGGADLTVGVHPNISNDPAIVELLPSLGVEVISAAEASQRDFDIVLDCAGLHKDVNSTFGYVELTHSGLAAYQSSKRPVIIVDHSPVKLLETMFGTGESFVRALAELGHVPSGGSLVVFGAGKVGSGIAYNARQCGLAVVVIDYKTSAANYANAPVIDVADGDAVSAAIASAWAVVTATGVPAAAAPFANDLNNTKAILANMGIEDEFGSGVASSRVLNNRRPVNFTLAEPTLLRFMDPIFALSNSSAVDLVHRGVPVGVNPPTRESEAAIIKDMRSAGVNLAELDAIDELESPRS